MLELFCERAGPYRFIPDTSLVLLATNTTILQIARKIYGILVANWVRYFRYCSNICYKESRKKF